MDLNIAVTSNVWLLSPAGWYATIELEEEESTRTKLLSLEGEAPHGSTRALQSATTAANTEPEEPGRNNTLQSPGITAHPPCPGEFGISHPT